MTATLEVPPRDLTSHKDNWIKLIGRIKPGMSIEQAAAGLQPAFGAILRDELPQFTWLERERPAPLSSRAK